MRAAVAGTAAFLVASLSALPADAAGSVKIGVLTCGAGPSIGLVITSSTKLSCSFVPDGGKPEHYSGRMRRIGLDIGITAASVIVWAVFSAQKSYIPGSIAGEYVGVSAQQTVILGLGANALVGGSNKQIGLQPLSVQGQAGLNLAVGVARLVLTRN
jgi:hypothetical protein